jgi:hypothetical protein
MRFLGKRALRLAASPSPRPSGERFPRMRILSIEPLNLSSPQGRSADSLVCCIADWQSAAAMLTRPQTYLRVAWCLEFGAFERIGFMRGPVARPTFGWLNTPFALPTFSFAKKSAQHVVLLCPLLSFCVPLCHFTQAAPSESHPCRGRPCTFWLLIHDFCLFKDHRLARSPQPSELVTFRSPNSSPRRSHAQTGALRTHYTPHLYHLFPLRHVPGEYKMKIKSNRPRRRSENRPRSENSPAIHGWDHGLAIPSPVRDERNVLSSTPPRSPGEYKNARFPEH